MSRKYTKEILSKAVENSVSFTGVVKYLGIHSKSGVVWSSIKRYIQEYDLDTSHFTGRSHAKGKPSNKRLPANAINRVLSGPHRETAARLRRALFEVGVPHKCSLCGLDKWQEAPITLEVDHIDGNWKNCHKENLRFLCPNCHSQMPTTVSQKIYIYVTCPICQKSRKIRKRYVRSERCSMCAAKIRATKMYKFEKGKWPSEKRLSELVWIKPMIVIASDIGVSDTSVRKRCKRFGIQTPPIGYWAKIQAGIAQ